MDVRRFDVFISYNSTDRDTVESVAQQLLRQRLTPWLDQWHLSPGARWQDEIVGALRSSGACAVMVGPGGLGDWVREELAVAHDQAAKDRAFRLFMVLLPNAPDLSDPSLAFLRTRTWVDLRRGVADQEGVQDLIAAITGAPRRRTAVAAAPDTCPYRGLESFDEDNARFFFGRDHDVGLALAKLAGSRFLAVLGPSGSGKSSLLRAGIVPALRRGAVSASDRWKIRVFTPGARPSLTLATQLAAVFEHVSVHRTLDELGDDPRRLDLAAAVGLADRPPSERVVLVIDQFEEVFTLCADEDDRKAFLANLVYAATVPGGRVVVIIGMRADFYQSAAAYSDLRAVVADQQFLVGPLDAEGLRRVIEEPAHIVDLELEAGLVDTILGDVGDRPGTLPLLEHVLLELWRRRRGGMLTLEAYVASGRVEGGLAQRANEVYATFTPARQRTVRRVLLRLVQPGEGTEDTRRRAELDELSSTSDERADVEAVVTALADQRLLTVSRDDATGRPVVDITHEALIRGWPELRGWINEARESLRLHRRLTDAATEWERSGKEEGLLYRGARLALWQERSLEPLNDLECAFLAASNERERRERAVGRRRTRAVVASLSVALVAITAVAVVALVLGNRAAEERDVARSRQLAASATAQLPIDPERSVLLAMEAFETRRTPQAEAVLRQAILEATVLSTWRGHEGAVHATGFSSDGLQVVTAGDDATVRVWDVALQRERVVLTGHAGPVHAAAFSRDGKLVVSASDDATVRVWDVTSQRERAVLTGHAGPVYAAAFSPDGQLVVSAGEDMTVRVWDVASQRERSVLTGHTAPVWGLAVSPDGSRLATGSDDSTVRVWALAGGDPFVLHGHAGPVQAVAFSPDSRRLVSTGEDSTVRVWDLEGGQTILIEGHVGLTNAASFSADGRRVISAGGDGSVRVSDVTGRAQPVVLRGHVGAVTDADLSPDGSTVISSGSDGTVRLWSSSRPGERAVLDARSGALTAVEPGPDGRAVMTASIDKTVRMWDVGTGTPRLLGTHEGAVIDAAMSPDGRHVVSGSEDATVRVWDVLRGGEPVAVRTTPGKVWTVAFAPDGRRLAAGGEDGRLRIWDWQSNDPPVVLTGHDGDVFAAAFSPDGRLLASGGADGSLRIWDLARQEEKDAFSEHEGAIYGVAFSNDNRYVLSASDDATVRIWDLAADRAPVVLRGHQGPVWKAVFSPDGALVASAGDDSTLRVWTVAGDREPLVLRGHAASLRSVRFIPDGSLLVSAGADSTARLWEFEEGRIDDDALLDLGRRSVTRSLTDEERATFLGR